ncbi:MAG: helix-turn-helix domain-containing protein [Phycisphaerales bacterium]|nr:helix-turn-helix domain-containing protein [Phycisphaerales bacterium]
MSNEMISDFTPGPEAIGVNHESLGSWLAQSRTGYGAEQREVAHHLGLNPTIIQALETDDFDRLGAPVFVRGYLSRYARLLNLPEQVVMERYRQQSRISQDPPPLKIEHSSRQARSRDSILGWIILLGIISIGWAAIQNLDKLDPSRLLALWPGTDSSNAPPIASAPVSAPTASTQTSYPFQSAIIATETSSVPATESPTDTPPRVIQSESSTAPTPIVAPPVPVATPTPTPTPVVSVPTPVSPAPEERTPIPSLPGVQTATAAPTENSTIEASSDRPAVDDGNTSLLLEFSGDCWVEVKDAQGKVLIGSLMRADSTKTLSGKAPFTITLGNAPAARLSLNGQPVDKAIYVPRRGTVSRFNLANPQP